MCFLRWHGSLKHIFDLKFVKKIISMKKNVNILGAIFLGLTLLSTQSIASGFFEDSTSLEERKPSTLLPLIKKYFHQGRKNDFTYTKALDFLQKNRLCISVLYNGERRGRGSVFLSEANEEGRLIAIGRTKRVIRKCAAALEYGLKKESHTVGR